MTEEKPLTDNELYHFNIALNAKTYGMKNVHKKTLAFELIKRGYNLDHTMRNKRNVKVSSICVH
ncbi:hypothetical protein ABFY48_16080 [Lysinibacillus pakistanensis]|uniref:hypothetical protein n=1 Tax=Lysinibacillus pakistanensis TaxID=759811 RepID=UPI003D2B6399